MGEIGAALRLGWAMAESRGRSWPHGPKPATSTELPLVPMDLLPLRFQRDASESRGEAVATLVGQAESLELPCGDGLHDSLLGDRAEIDADTWPELARTFRTVDTEIQDQLTQRDDRLANAYLLGRGLAECYWGLGPETEWEHDGVPSGVSLAYLFGEPRRRELTRMLGRVKAPGIHELSPSAISGSLEAWGGVAGSREWSAGRQEYVAERLYEQVRRWYQLLILGQDPTTMIKPSAELANRYYLAKTLKAFWLQGVLALVAVGLTSTFFLSITADFMEKAKPLLATGGVSALAAAGVLTKGQSAAQRMLARLRQDAYTDLVAVSVTAVPNYPEVGWRDALPDRAQGEQRWQRASDEAADKAWSRARATVEKAVRQRRLTPPTPPPPT